MAVELKWRHQQKAYELMKKKLESAGKAAYVFQTGAGKSFPALRYVEENPEKNVLIISPYITVNDQFKRYIREYVQDGKKRLKEKNIVIVTYQKVSLLEGITLGLRPDIIIFDEIHRMGAEKWEPAVDSLTEAFPDAKEIGMSATPERLDRRNMAYEKFGDSIVYQMSLTEALSGEKEGEVVLNPIKYYRVLSALNETIAQYREQIERVEDEEEKRKSLIKKCEQLSAIIGNSPQIADVMYEAMKERPNGKYIVFCKDGDDLQKKMKEAQAIFGKVNSNINCEYVLTSNGRKDGFGKTPKENKVTIQKFERLKKGNALNLLFCVDMLNEGIHIDGVDGEVLFDLTRSPIKFKQRIGRIHSTDANENIVVDAVGNWIEQLDVYRKLEQAMLKGKERNRKVQNSGIVRNSNKVPNIDDKFLQLEQEELRLLDIMKELNERLRYRTSLENAKEIKEWCERNFGTGDNIDKNKRVPIRCSKDENEKRMAINMYAIKTRICRRYEEKELSEIENEEHREIVGIMRYVEDTYKSDYQKKMGDSIKSGKTSLESAREIKEWCEKNFGNGEEVSKDKRIPAVRASDKEEAKMGVRLNGIKTRICNKYDGIAIEDIPNEEHRQIVEITRRIYATYMSDRQREFSKRTSKTATRIRNSVTNNIATNQEVRNELEGKNLSVEKEI